MSVSQASHLIFVYGGLKRGFGLAHELQDQTFLQTAVTQPGYRLFDCGEYPGLVDAAAEGVSVTGEVYRVSAACLSRLDEVEAVDEGLYERRRIELAAPFDSQHVLAYFYLRPVAGLRDCGTTWL